MKKLLSLALITLLSGTLFTSCKKDKGEPPVLPPVESMTIDFSNFASLKKSADLPVGQKGSENSNWEFSAAVAGVWKLIISTTLAVPVASFKLAANQIPVYLSEKNWQWSYTVPVAGVTYKARLTGVIGTSNTWKMYITKEGTGGFAEFLWFEGTSKLDGTEGQWIFYESSQSQGAILQVDWAKTGASIGGIKYTYVKTGDPFKNSYIEYGLTTSTLNAYFNIHYFNTLKFSDVNIEWNTTTKNGRVKCVDYLGVTDWHCWNENKINAVCQ